MDISVHHKTETNANREKGHRPKQRKKRRVERRKTSADRRRLVNDGIVVRLSTSPEERRERSDRRQNFTPPHILQSAQQSSVSVFVDTVA